MKTMMNWMLTGLIALFSLLYLPMCGSEDQDAETNALSLCPAGQFDPCQNSDDDDPGCNCGTEGVTCYCDAADLLREKVAYTDEDNDGDIDHKYTSTYDANGNLITFEQDWNNDGTVDKRVTYRYDQNNRLIGKQEDSDDDGAADDCVTFDYNESGQLVRATLDIDCDGTTNSVCTYTPPSTEPDECSQPSE